MHLNMLYMQFRWENSLADPCFSFGAVVLRKYDEDISVTPELLEDIVEPTMTVFGVVLGLGLWAGNNRHHISRTTTWYIEHLGKYFTYEKIKSKNLPSKTLSFTSINESKSTLSNPHLYVFESDFRRLVKVTNKPSLLFFNLILFL